MATPPWSRSPPGRMDVATDTVTMTDRLASRTVATTVLAGHAQRSVSAPGKLTRASAGAGAGAASNTPRTVRKFVLRDLAMAGGPSASALCRQVGGRVRLASGRGGLSVTRSMRTYALCLVLSLLTLPSPYLTSPHITLSDLIRPYLTSPHLNKPDNACPDLT